MSGKSYRVFEVGGSVSYKRLLQLQMLSRVTVAEVVVEACQPKAMLEASGGEEGATRVNNRI